MRRALLTMPPLCALLLIAACGMGSSTATSSSGTGTATAKSALCQGVAKIDQALTSLSQIGSNTTVGEAQAKQSQVSDALNNIEARLPGPPSPCSRNFRRRTTNWQRHSRDIRATRQLAKSPSSYRTFSRRRPRRRARPHSSLPFSSAPHSVAGVMWRCAEV
jgi:hypothetical protein